MFDCPNDEAMKANDPILYELLARYFAGETNADEARQIANWLAENPENQQLMDRLHQIWADTGVLLPANEKQYDVDLAWRKVARRTSGSSFRTYWRVAAAVVLLACVWVILRWPNTTQHTLTTAFGPQELRLPDSSTVTLDTGSSLQYYASVFGRENRTVYLKGNALFQVQRDTLVPFAVQAGDAQVEVLGTVFSVSATEQAVTVVVQSGRVQLSHKVEEVTLGAGEGAVLRQAQISLLSPQQISTGEATYWNTGKLTFAGHTLQQVANILSRIHGVDIRLDEAIRHCKLTVSFDGDTLPQALEVIQTTLGLDLVQEGSTYILQGEGCGGI